MPAEIIIVDDDPLVGNLTRDILAEAGFASEIVRNPIQAHECIRKAMPRLIIMDIMMPGIDGLSLLRELKSDEQTRKIKVIILSAKTFPADKERAMHLGADLFIGKPYHIDTFNEAVISLIGQPQNPEAAKPEAAPPGQLRIRFWGCRGFSDSVQPSQTKFGTLTPCVSIEGPSAIFVFDAGTGIIPLGQALSASKPSKTIWIALSHYHKGHVSGLSQFPPAQDKSFIFKIAGPSESPKKLRNLVTEIFLKTPGALPLNAKVDLYELAEGEYELAPGIKLSTIYTHHPGNTLGFSLETEDKKFVYCPDSELFGESATAFQDYDQKLADFCRGADILIHDAYYTEEDYEKNANSGHSSAENALGLAVEASVKELVLFHLNPAYPDDKLEGMEQAILRKIEKQGLSLSCKMAREGLTTNI